MKEFLSGTAIIIVLTAVFTGLSVTLIELLKYLYFSFKDWNAGDIVLACLGLTVLGLVLLGFLHADD